MATQNPAPTTRLSAPSPAAELLGSDDGVFCFSLAQQQEFTTSTMPATPAAAPSGSVVADGAGWATALSAFDL